MPPPIYRLPNELTFVVVLLLDVEDAFSLGQTCRRFHHVVRNNGVCRRLLEKSAPFSREYRDACTPNSGFTYTRALHTLAKSRCAVATLQPFVAAVVARDVDVHVYANRTLLYMCGRDLRVLGLGRSAVVRREMVIDVPAMLAASLPESKGCTRYKFRPVHFAAGYVTCLYTHQRARAAREQWLVVLSASGCLTTLRVTAPHNKIFVRNNAEYLVVGTLTGRPEDNEANGITGGWNGDDDDDDGLRSSYHAGRYWVLRRFSFRSGRWSDHKIYLDAIGCADLGTDVAFELLDDDDEGGGRDGGTLYALALQTRRATWSRRYAFGMYSPMSYYCCVRMPLRHPALHQQATRVSRWRRRNDEGPLDDRFCSLAVERNEATGALTVVEARKEWRNRYGGGRRTYYKQELVFEEGGVGGSVGETTSDELDGMVSIIAEDDEDEDDDYEDDDHPADEDQEVYARAPENVHPGDSATDMAMFSFSDTAAHLYIASCATFVDLVNLPDPESPSTPRMVLRAGSRRPHPPGLVMERGGQDGRGGGGGGVGAGPAQAQAIDNDNDDDNDHGHDDPLYPLGEIRRRFKASEVMAWPRDVDARDSDGGGRTRPPADGRAAGDYAALHQILNPPGYGGHARAQWDDYTLVCATGGDGDNSASQPGLVGRPSSSSGGGGAAKKTKKAKQALVLVSFDPTLCLPGLPRWSDRVAPQTAAAHGGPTPAPAPAPAQPDSPPSVESLSLRETAVAGKTEPLQPSWVSFDAPTYRRQTSGFDFFY